MPTQRKRKKIEEDDKTKKVESNSTGLTPGISNLKLANPSKAQVSPRPKKFNERIGWIDES